MARAFNDIYAELGSQYDPSAKLIQDQISAIPGSTDALVAQAEAKKTQAFDDITNAARRRGMGFSGIPLQEQAVYASTEFAPAVARVKSDAEGRKVTLIESLNTMNRDRSTRAQSVYDNELARDFQERQFQEQIRQFNEQQAAAAAQASAGSAASDLSQYFGANGANTQALTKGPSFGYKNGKNGSGGFWFTDASGKPISAAAYAKQAGTNVVALIRRMANEGDKGAQNALRSMSGPGFTTANMNSNKGLFW